MGDIDPVDAERVLASMVVESRRMFEQPVTDAVLREASRLVDAHGLRALDSIQLGSALIVQKGLAEDVPLTFVTADERLLTAAIKEGMFTWNPAKAVLSETSNA